MPRRAYIGITKEVPISADITVDNISSAFTVTNGSPYYFAGNGNIFTTNNKGVPTSTASTSLTALYDMTVSFIYSYSSKNSYDKFTLTIGDTIIENAVSGPETIKTWSGHVSQGEVISFKYAKDGSQNGNGDECYFTNMIATIGTETKSVAHKITVPYFSKDGKARSIKKIYIGDPSGKARLTVTNHEHEFNNYQYEKLNIKQHKKIGVCSCGDYTSFITDHDAYGDVSANWSSNHTSCTATATCACGHEITETQSAYKRTQIETSTCKTRSQWDYAVTFNNAVFGTRACPDYHYGSLDPDNHEQAKVETSRTPATCIATGSVSYKYPCCEADGGTETLSIDPENHASEEHHVNEETMISPTCSDYGYFEVVHDCCGKIFLSGQWDNLLPDNHEFAELNFKAPTCTEYGLLSAKVCNWCNKWYTLDGTFIADGPGIPPSLVIEPRGHNISLPDNTEPTCTEAGWNTDYQLCWNCNQAFDSEGNEYPPQVAIIPALGHSYSYPCSKVCLRCGEATNTTGHNFVLTSTKPATCTSTGTKYYDCSYDCGAGSQETIEIDPNNHTGTIVNGKWSCCGKTA